MQHPLFLMFGDIGGSEVLLIMVVILIFFGANKIPELARGLGKGIREFKDASTEIRREFEQSGQPAQPNYNQQPNYAQHQYPAPLPVAPVTEPGSGFDPWAPSASTIPGHAAEQHIAEQHNVAAESPAPEHHAAAEEPALPVAYSLPPNMAPEGTQPRQPYLPVNPDA